MGIGQSSVWATAIGALLMGLAALLTPWLARRSARDATAAEQARVAEQARLAEEARQAEARIREGARQAEERQQEIALIFAQLRATIDDMQEEQGKLRATIERHEGTVERLNRENAECWADRAQLRTRLTEQERAIRTLTGDNARLATRVADLEKGTGAS